MFLTHENESITSKYTWQICLSYRVAIFLGAFEIPYNAQVCDHRDHVTSSVITLYMLTTDSNLFISLFNRKSVPGSHAGEVLHLVGGMDGDRNH